MEEELSEQELRDFLRTRLAKFKIPALIWIQKESLLRGGTGKIHKRGMKEEKLAELLKKQSRHDRIIRKA